MRYESSSTRRTRLTDGALFLRADAERARQRLIESPLRASRSSETPGAKQLPGLIEAPRLRSRLGIFLVVLVLHAAGLMALLLLSHASERVRGAVSPIEVQIIAVAPARPEGAPPLPRLALERPPIKLIMPEVPSSESAPDAPTVASPAPAVAETPAATIPEAAPGPAEPVTPPRFDAAYLKNPPPAYPTDSRRMREQGTVLMRVRVSRQGTAVDVLIEHTSGAQRLDEAALEAVRNWRFVPAHRGTEAVEAWVLVPVEFALQR